MKQRKSEKEGRKEEQPTNKYNDDYRITKHFSQITSIHIHTHSPNHTQTPPNRKTHEARRIGREIKQIKCKKTNKLCKEQVM